jgi:Flp pilus assembly protein TadG
MRAQPDFMQPRSKIRGTFSKLIRCRGGASAVEFAIVAPVLLLMTICTFDLGIGFYRYLQVETAAGVGARYATLHGFDSTAIGSAITNATSYSGISASPTPSTFCGCPSGSGISAATCGSTCTGGAVAGTYVKVSAQTSYSPIMSYPLMPSSFLLSAQSTMRIQ